MHKIGKKIVEYLTKLPGIGPRQATRLTLALADWQENEIRDFAETLTLLKSNSTFCTECFNFSDKSGKCAICSDLKRDQSKIAVVEKISDIESIERAGQFNGLFHVLGGLINPARGILPENVRILELISRVKEIKKSIPDLEVILATNPSAYGETTALYIEGELRPLGVKTTRLARGLASGTFVEYADEITLSNAFKHRK